MKRQPVHFLRFFGHIQFLCPFGEHETPTCPIFAIFWTYYYYTELKNSSIWLERYGTSLVILINTSTSKK
jgi:hypothetical protein